MDGERYIILTLIRRKLEKLYEFQTMQSSEQEKLTGTKGSLHNSKGFILQDDIGTLNVYISNNRASKYMR